MATRAFPHWIPWWALLVTAVASAAAVGVFTPAPIPEKVYLPGEAVVTEVIPQSVLDQMAAGDALIESLGIRLDATTGELRDAENRLLNLRESLAVDTGPIAPPEPEIVERIVYRICDEQLPPSARARLEAFKFEGLTATGDLSHGWTGWIRCEIAAHDASEWAVLVEEPFTLSNTRSAASAPPEPPRRLQRWYVGGQWAALTESFDNYDVYTDTDRWRFYGGRTWFPGKRVSVATGVFVEKDGAGLDLRVDF